RQLRTLARLREPPGARQWFTVRVGRAEPPTPAEPTGPGPDLAAAREAARQSLIGRLQGAAVGLLKQTGVPPQELVHQLTAEALAVRADAVLANLNSEE